MPKESFEQFFKRQKEKLDKAEKMVERVKERLKTEEVEKKIEEYIEKSVKKLKRLWAENEEKIRKKDYWDGTFSFISSFPLPETSPSFLERISNKFLKEFDWKKFEGRKFLEDDLGLFLSAFLHKNTENYISSQKKKGIKEKNIKPIKIHLDVKELPVRLSMLGYQNPEKLHLTIEGDCEKFTGIKMQGGKIIVKGNCRNSTGYEMEKGEIIVEGNCRNGTGWQMEGGELNIKGEVKSFDESAFSSNNRGTIIWRKKIWENGDWTKEGKEMWEKGEIPVR